MPTLAPPGAPAPAHELAQPERWRLATPPTPTLVAMAAVVAIVGDVAIQAGFAGAAAALTFATAAVVLLRSGRLERPTGRWLVAAAPLFGGWLAVRTSPWLLPLDVLAATGLLVLGTTMARGGSIAQLPPVAVVARLGHAAGHLAWAPSMLRGRQGAWRSPDEPSLRWRAVARGVAVALPVVVVLGALLASADAVFASIFDPAIRSDRLAAHAFGFAFVGWLALGLLRAASAPPPTEPAAPRHWLGATEATIVLGAVAALFAVFVLTQALTALGGADHVIETAGLTRAEYARSGFFQLLWVAALTIVGLVVVAHVTDLEGPRRAPHRWLAAAIAALALVMVVVAVIRLDLYRDAFGWTMLRLSCTAFAAWLGGVLVLLGVALAGPARVRRLGWFVPAALALGLAILLALNVVNPEALVARHNLTRDATVVVDVDYLDHLSDDALPTIVALLPELDPATEALVRERLGCTPDGGDDGWAGWNLGVERADDARRALCRA